METEQLKDIMLTALKSAGEVLLNYFGNVKDIQQKENNSSIVTEADLAAENAIFDVLSKQNEPCNIISEESGFTGKDSEYTWVIDPLDGTSNFAASLPWFGILMALFHKREPILAGMFLPLEKEIYYAEKGKGAWKNDIPIRTADATDLKDVLISYSFDFSEIPGKTGGEMKLIERLASRVRNLRSTNSLVDFCCTADGRLGASLNQSTKIWDIAAPWLVIREAGGCVTDIKGIDITFDVRAESISRNYTIAASASGIHEQLVSILISNT